MSFQSVKYYVQLNSAELALQRHLTDYFRNITAHNHDARLKSIKQSIEALYRIQQAIQYFKNVDAGPALPPPPPKGAP